MPKICDCKILRFTVGIPTSSYNVAFHWLVFGFTQVTALAVLSKKNVFFKQNK